MEFGFASDFTSDIKLDAQLSMPPSSGVYLNSGAHPSVTLGNILAFMPDEDYPIADWDTNVSYGAFESSRNLSDIVALNGEIYQSLSKDNLGNSPDVSGEWLLTNRDSLLLKDLVRKTTDRMQSELNLTKRLVNNQFLYETGRVEIALPADYAAWVFEPKGSDYVSFTINQISFQKKSSDPVNLYVINQGVLVDTLTVTPDNGRLNFSELGYGFSGKGAWTFAIDSTDVLVDHSSIDPLNFEGFVAYTATGTGASPETATYSYNTTGNGLGFNISVELDSKVYIDNNLRNLGGLARATFEYLVFQMFLHNPNNVSSREQRIQMSEEILQAELKDMEHDTVVRRMYSEKKRAFKMLEKAFDTQLSDTNDFEIEIATI